MPLREALEVGIVCQIDFHSPVFSSEEVRTWYSIHLQPSGVHCDIKS